MKRWWSDARGRGVGPSVVGPSVVGPGMVGPGMVGWISVLGACGTTRAPDDIVDAQMTLSGEILRELETFGAAFSARWVIYVAIVFAIAIAARRLTDSMMRVAWRLGWDPERRLARGRSVLDLTFAAVALLATARPVLVAAPLLAPVAGLVVCLVLAIAAPPLVQDLLAGIELARRSHFREGDQIFVGDQTGTVREIGLLRTRLRDGDGATLTLPNRIITGSSIRVGRDTGAVPLTWPLPPRLGDDPELRERVLALAVLFPFRRAGSRPQLRQTERGWTLQVQTWATRDGPARLRCLERTILEQLGGPDAA